MKHKLSAKKQLQQTVPKLWLAEIRTLRDHSPHLEALDRQLLARDLLERHPKATKVLISTSILLQWRKRVCLPLRTKSRRSEQARTYIFILIRFEY